MKKWRRGKDGNNDVDDLEKIKMVKRFVRKYSKKNITEEKCWETCNEITNSLWLRGAQQKGLKNCES